MDSSCTFAVGDMGSSKSSMMRWAMALTFAVSMKPIFVGMRPR